MSSPPCTESLVLQRVRALGGDETNHNSGKDQRQESFQDPSVQQSFEAKKSIFMKPSGNKSEDQSCTTNSNVDSPTVRQRLAALNKATEQQETSETCGNMGSVKARLSAFGNQQPSREDGKNLKDISSSIRVFESKSQADSVSDKSVVNVVKKTLEQKIQEPTKGSNVSKRIQELSGKKQTEPSQVRQLASRLETKQKTETEKPVHSTLTKLKEKFEASGSKLAANQYSKQAAQSGYVMETSKLFGGATVFKFSGVSKSSNESEKNADDIDSKSGCSNVQSKVMFYIKFQEQRKDETFSPRSGSQSAEANSQRFSSVAELRALFGTSGKPELEKLSKKNRQVDASPKNTDEEKTRKNQNDDNEEEGDVMLEQALCRRILGKEVRRALKNLLAQQRLDALKCQATEKDIEGREVKPLIDEFQQRRMDDSEHVGVFTNRMRKGRISTSPEMDTLETSESNITEKTTNEMEDTNIVKLEPDVLEKDESEQDESCEQCNTDFEKNDLGDDESNEEGCDYGSYEIVIDPEFVRRRIEELQACGEDESDSDDDDDDDEPVLIKTRSGRIVVDTSQYQKISVRMAMRIAF
ncbi:hypothetical protein GpartN1_g3182.t1 [Galdieria partita]|uniref:Uncharacterized protein n=1 Tax=Galdieria partita TaxID=83374 RepID=A0A9C7PVR4_9RHOD|nr:hypothetical protein GpartN1_g3182.t1 [Galdieria partita]